MLLAVQACTYQMRHVVSPTEPFPELENRPVDVTLADQRVLLMTHPRVVGDSLAGDIIDRRDGRVAPGAVALRDIRILDEERIDVWGTVIVATLASLATFLVVLFRSMPHS